MYLIKGQQQAKICEAKQALAQNKQKWMQENKTGYDLGYRSKNWLPFLTSYLQPASYFNIPYQIGLEDALYETEKKVVRTAKSI
jgi:hypothetical protein